MEPAADPNHPGNSAEYHTGKPCIVKGCKAPAGTWWGPHWCQEHNHARLEKIGATLESMVQRAAFSEAVDKATEALRQMLHDAYAETQALVLAAGGRVVVKPEHRNVELSRRSVYTPQGRDGPATYEFEPKRSARG